MENTKKQVINQQATTLPAVIKTAEQKEHSAMVLNAQFTQFAKSQGVTLSSQDVEYGRELISELTQKLMEDGTDTSKINLRTFLSDVKDCAKLGLSKKNKEIYFDTRNNGKTGQVDIKIKRQYQGEKSILVNFCEKKIIRFLDGVVCRGDTFEFHNDFTTGLQVIDKHIQSDKDRNSLNNITYAYAIAYVQEDGKLVPYTCIIDDIRIKRAKSCATTDKVWNADARAMAIKTAYWCLKQMLEPYMTKNIEISKAIANTEDDIIFNQEENSQVIDIDNLNEIESDIDDISHGEELQELPNFEDEEINDLICSDCGVMISEKVSSFSKNKFGKPLCMDCQKNQK